MLINLTNHPSANWNEEQREEAVRQWGKIEDYSFPAVGSEWDNVSMMQYAQAIVSEVVKMNPDAVLCQGEMSMTFLLVAMLQKKGIPVYAATSERRAKEELQPDGSICKSVVFSFVMFRKYCTLAEI